MKFQHLPLSLALLLNLFSSGYQTHAQETQRRIKETLLATLNDTLLADNSYSCTADMRMYAYIIHEENKQRIVINNVKGKLFDLVNAPVFSPDSKSFIYRAFTGNRWLWVNSNNEEITAGKGETISFARFSPDNKTLVFIISKSGKFFLKFKGALSKGYNAIDENTITFSRDGSKMACQATLGTKKLILSGGRESKLYDQAGFPVLSEDGKHLAYWVALEKKKYAVIDDKLSQPFDYIYSILFSQNGKHYAIHALQDNKQVAVYDGVPGEKFKLIHSLCLNKDGSNMAFGFEMDPEKKELDPKKEVFTNYLFSNGEKNKCL